MLCGRLASLKDSTNPSYKKTEETVGVTLTVKMIKMTEDVFQTERINKPQVRVKKLVDIVYKKP